MPNIITAKLDLAKVHGAKVLRKDGRTFIEVTDSQLYEGKTGALYLDVALFDTAGGQYGDWRITQDLSRALRDAGHRGAILGSGKNKAIGGSQPAKPAPATPPPADNIDEDVPF